MILPSPGGYEPVAAWPTMAPSLGQEENRRRRPTSRGRSSRRTVPFYGRRTMHDRFRLTPVQRRRILRLLPVVCSPDAASSEFARPVLDHVERALGSYPRALRRALLFSLRLLSRRRFVRWFDASSSLRRCRY